MNRLKRKIAEKLIEKGDLLGQIRELQKRYDQLKEYMDYGEDLNMVQNVAGVGSWKYDAEADQFDGTEELYRIYGVDPIDFKRNFRSVIRLIHPQDQNKVVDEMRRRLSGETTETEFRIPQKDGSMKHVKSKGRPIFDDNGKIIGIMGTLQDRTKEKQLEIELKKSNEVLAKAEALAQVGSWELDIEENRFFMSNETRRIYGLNPKEISISLERFLKIIHPDDVEKIRELLEDPPRKLINLDIRIVRPDNTIRSIYQQVEFVFNENDKPIFVYGTIQDITKKKELENKILNHRKEIDKIQKRFQVLVQESNDVYEILSPDGTILYISDAVERVMGYRPDERIGKRIFEFYDGADLEKIRKMIELVLSEFGKKIQGELTFVTKLGERVNLELYMQNLLHDSSINGIVVNFRDITSRVEMEKTMAHISTHDPLTDLPNTIYCAKRLRLQCEYSKNQNRRFALMMLDIGGLKYATYSLGYEFGETLILEIVRRLKKTIGRHRFLSRHSDDHFAIIVDDMEELKEYESLANEIINQFRDVYKINKYELDVHVNIGIGIYPQDGEDIHTLRVHAKSALIRAKKEGKNTFKFYSSDLDIQNYKEFVLRSDLHSALEEGQLKVYYQPIVNIKTNKILGAEALARWEHPEWGLVESEEFISLAEDTGKIIDIGKWVLRQVCKDYRQWLIDGHTPIKVSVNFSAVQFLEKDFVENIRKIIEEFDLEPNFLIIEITENILLGNVEKVNSDINGLRDIGIQVAMDDFGTGYSSLIYLNSFNIDIIKLDKSFIKNIPVDIGSVAITKTVVRLARELKLRFVAEGIETYDQLQLLKGLNAIGGQGFLYSYPKPAEEFEKILRKGVCKPAAFFGLDAAPRVERRKLFRVKFIQLLEADLTILELKGKKINVGNTKVLVKDMGPGGLCFISDIRFPVEKNMILQFKTELVGEQITVYGNPVWTEQIDDKAYKYGIEFKVDENERMELIRILNKVQIKMRKDVLFAEGNFFPGNHVQYFAAYKKSM